MEQSVSFELAIISSRTNFYRRMKFLEARGFPRNRIIDGRVFRIPELNFPRLLSEGVAYGILEDNEAFTDTTSTIYPLVYRFKNNSSVISFGIKSYIAANTRLEGTGMLLIGKFTGIAWNNSFEFGLNNGHDYKKVRVCSHY